MNPKLSWKIVTYTLLILWALFTVMPLYWLLSATFKPPGEAIGYPPTLVPRHPTLRNFGDLLFRSKFGFKSYLNSIEIAVGATLISTGCAMLAGFGFSRFRFPLRNQILVLILLIQMIPLLAVIIPLYRLYSLYGLYDTRFGLMIVYAVRTVSMNTWLLKGYFDTIPVEIEEAALIDGCSRVQTITRIMIPIAVPGLVTAMIYTFIYAWNEFLFGLTFIQSRPKMPLVLALYNFVGRWSTQWELLTTAAFLAIIPVLVLFYLIERRLVAGLAGGAVKA